MTRNKLANQVKGHGTGRRDFRRVEGHGRRPGRRRARHRDGWRAWPGRALRPAARSPCATSWTKPGGDCPAEELSLLERRQQGSEWTEIAAELGSSPDAIRKRLARAVDRVAQELGLDDRADDS